MISTNITVFKLAESRIISNKTETISSSLESPISSPKDFATKIFFVVEKNAVVQNKPLILDNSVVDRQSPFVYIYQL